MAITPDNVAVCVLLIAWFMLFNLPALFIFIPQWFIYFQYKPGWGYNEYVYKIVWVLVVPICLGFAAYWVFQTPPVCCPLTAGGFNEWGWDLLVVMLIAGLCTLFHFSVVKWRWIDLSIFILWLIIFMTLAFAVFAAFWVNLTTVGVIIVGVLSAIVIIIAFVYFLWLWAIRRCHGISLLPEIDCTMSEDQVRAMARPIDPNDDGYYNEKGVLLKAQIGQQVHGHPQTTGAFNLILPYKHE